MSAGVSAPVVKRLQAELADLRRTHLPPFLRQLRPEATDGGDDVEDLTRWEAVLRGAPGSPYEHGQWLVTLRVPDEYPMRPPEVRFQTRVCHPNVDFKVRETLSANSLLKQIREGP